MTGLSTHVLDATLGRPAVGVLVSLIARHDADQVPIATAVTDDDGRVASLGPASLQPGDYHVPVLLSPAADHGASVTRGPRRR